jgi:hypothetical protein
MLKLFIQYHEEDVPTIDFSEIITEAYQQAKEMEKQDFITCASNAFNHAYDFLKIKE